ncbi:hypothetical protein KsCSTR_17080 [Candidatus Kuenenia stuttgartiensis]|uniref:Uncharacterized protein n=1 Tax=Kuenenia stuttgartiensis TaxID=174633 RepID=Q1Q211_KUEST|nr:hypothetical protein KsCSTR_17080 [Candidatus Kuenenia stuttgartiensis]CAJ74056.1 unknown protein [Candidatus Kuenenia stuttgartiensis]
MFFVINIPPNTLEILPFQSYSCNKALPCLQDLGVIIIPPLNTLTIGTFCISPSGERGWG